MGPIKKEERVHDRYLDALISICAESTCPRALGIAWAARMYVKDLEYKHMKSALDQVFDELDAAHALSEDLKTQRDMLVTQVADLEERKKPAPTSYQVIVPQPAPPSGPF